MANAFCSSIPIPKFDEDEYDFWSTKMKNYFCVHNLWDVVSKGYTVLDDFSNLTFAEKKKLLEKNKRMDSYALFVLQMSLTGEYFSRIKRAETSKAAWDILKEDFQEEYFIQSPKDPFATDWRKGPCTTEMKFNAGTNLPVNENRKLKSKNKKRDEGRQNVAADPNNTPPGSDRIHGRAYDSYLKDDSSSSKKRRVVNRDLGFRRQ